MNDVELTIPASIITTKIPADLPLQERVAFAMRYVREHESDLFWMTGRLTDDLRIRAALAGVMLAGNSEDRTVIEHSIMPMKMLAAAAQGIPVDFSALDLDAPRLPIIKLWNDSAAATS